MSISVPEKSANSREGYDRDFSLEILRGVAQLQTKINLGFLESRQDSGLKNVIDRYHRLPDCFINNEGIRGKGLKVLAVNDANDICTAKKVAEALSKRDDVVGFIGHYASAITVNTVDIYQQHNLAMISSGSTASSLTAESRPNFFRTVYRYIP